MLQTLSRIPIRVLMVLAMLFYVFPAVMAINAPVANAATYTVTVADGDSDGTCNADCTLREAVAAANASSGADIISVPSGTYNSAATITLNDDEPTTISGAGLDTTILCFNESCAGGNGTMSGVDDITGFELEEAGTAAPMAFNNLTINIDDTSDSSYGIYVPDTGSDNAVDFRGDIDITNVKITGVTRADLAIANGGSIVGPSVTSNLTITNSTFESGGEANVHLGQFTPSITTEGSWEGDISIDGSTLTIDDHNISGGSSTAQAFFFGGMDMTGDITITDNTVNLSHTDTIADNAIAIYDPAGSDDGYGGGAHNVITGNVTITGNTVNEGTSARIVGGILSAIPTTGTSTVSNNNQNWSYTSGISGLGGFVNAVFDFGCFQSGCLSATWGPTVIQNNTINVSGMDDGQAIQAMGSTITISGNSADLNDATASAGIVAFPKQSSTINIYDNFLVGVNGTGGLGAATGTIADGATMNVTAYNNVLSGGSSNTGIGEDFDVIVGFAVADLFGAGTNTYNLDFYNNTVFGFTDSGGTNPAISIANLTDDETVTIDSFNNSISDGDAVYLANGATVQDDYNNTHSMTDGYNGVTAGANATTTDPGYADEANDDFTFGVSGNLVDAGVATSFSINAPATDIDGVTRPQRAGVDQGAYEYENAVPNAAAGTDQDATIGEEVTLDCSGTTDADDGSLTFAWTQTAGTSVSLAGASTDTATFTPASFGSRTFQCEADDSYDTDTDSAVVDVNAKRIGGADRFETAVNISNDRYADNSVSTVILAYSQGFAGALAAGPLASLLDVPILLSNTSGATTTTYDEIDRVWDAVDDAGTDIYLIGGTSVLNNSLVSALQSRYPTADIKRLAGSNRIEAAVNIAAEMDLHRGSNPTEVAIAYGYGFAAATAIAPIAGNKNINAGTMPILLTEQSYLPSSVKNYITSKKASINEAYISGGTDVVSTNIGSTLAPIIGASNITRFGGSTRYETTTLIADHFFDAPTAIAISNGTGFSASLTGGPNASVNNMPTLFVNDSAVSSYVNNWVTANAGTLNTVTLYGGTSVIPNGIKTTVQGLL